MFYTVKLKKKKNPFKALIEKGLKYAVLIFFFARFCC